MRYVGVGLISGSIVHAGTLGGDVTHYIALVALGVVAFIVGTLLEKGRGAVTFQFIAISVALSIGVGMVSGGTQHYLDGPVYAAFLVPLGLLLGYIAFVIREDIKGLTLRKIVIATISALVLLFVLYTVAHTIPVLDDHHNQTEGHH